MSQVERRQALCAAVSLGWVYSLWYSTSPGLSDNVGDKKEEPKNSLTPSTVGQQDLEWIHSTYKHNFEWPNDT